jgi:hypothetical protein
MSAPNPHRHAANEYHLLTIWHIAAPLTDVYDAIGDSLRWPAWWHGAVSVDQTAPGDRIGVGSVRHYAWQGKLPYPVVFNVRATRISPVAVLEGQATGDLEGLGRWSFSSQGPVSIVQFDWHIHSTKWWMNLLVPIARPFFIQNHAQLMKQGGQGLARHLHCSLLKEECIDLMARDPPPKTEPLPRHQAGRVNPLMLLLSGIVAGIVATIAQLILWWLADTPILATLLRDAQLTAAIVMGSGVLPPPMTAQWDILLVATMLHFGLSVIYAILPAHFAGRLNARQALLGGAAYGMAIYAINLHGFTAIFPWFVVSRDWVTLAAHAVFGMALTVWWLAYPPRAASIEARGAGR